MQILSHFPNPLSHILNLAYFIKFSISKQLYFICHHKNFLPTSLSLSIPRPDSI